MFTVNSRPVRVTLPYEVSWYVLLHFMISIIYPIFICYTRIPLNFRFLSFYDFMRCASDAIFPISQCSHRHISLTAREKSHRHHYIWDEHPTYYISIFVNTRDDGMFGWIFLTISECMRHGRRTHGEIAWFLWVANRLASSVRCVWINNDFCTWKLVRINFWYRGNRSIFSWAPFLAPHPPPQRPKNAPKNIKIEI